MFQKLVNRNDDIRRLVEKGYAVAFDSNYLIIRDIPYLDDQGRLQTGAIVSKIVFVDKEQITQDDHQIFFAGSFPHNIDGTPIRNLAGGETSLALSEAAKDVVVQRSFSNKPIVNGVLVGFDDFYEKIESYVGIISGPAIESHKDKANPYTFRAVEAVPDSVFKFNDTLTSRAEITDLSAKFANDVVAVIGLGGTGAYVLDMLVKTPVREIRGFDRDVYHVHNAFRSPGRTEEQEFGKSKSEVYQQRYDNCRHGLSLIPKFVDESCAEDFKGVTFAFVCVDKGSSRAGIFNLLISMGIPFIDVGMGLNRKMEALNGMLRATHYSVENGQKVRDMKLAETADDPDDIYRTNIQIGELNALNACLAVIKFKQIRGFYFEETPSFHLVFGIGDCKIAEESEFE
jgi:hypothetical protein